MKKIGILYGISKDFPLDLLNYINSKNLKSIKAELVKIGHIRQDDKPDYNVMLDRASYEVPFYIHYLKKAFSDGVTIVNNPFNLSIADNFLISSLVTRAGIKMPKTVILPPKEHPTGIGSESYDNMIYPINWEEVFNFTGFPAYIKPNLPVSGNNSYKLYNQAEFFTAYDFSGSGVMMLQEFISADAYYKCFVIGKEFVRIIKYEPGRPLHLRYIYESHEIDAALKLELENISRKICHIAGFDFNAVEIAVRNGIPYAVEFLNPVPGIEKSFILPDDYDWLVATTADYLVGLAKGKNKKGNTPLGILRETAQKSNLSAKTRGRRAKKTKTVT